MSPWTIHHGDCATVMATLPPQSVDAIITSPPYAMQRKATYGGVSETDYPAWTVTWMEQARRILKPNGSVVINIRPHIRNGQISDYTLRTRLALREAGWCEVDELIWHKPNAMPLGSLARPRRSWESLHWFAHHGRPWTDPQAAGNSAPQVTRAAWAGRAPRLGWDVGQGAPTNSTPTVARVTDVATVASRAGSMDLHADHPAPYPPALAEWVARLVCPPGGMILDPFSGSASTGVAAIRNGWHYIGIEAAVEYVESSRRRLNACQPTLDFGVA